MLEWMQKPHRRLNPLTGEWVLVSPQRTSRPWQGEVEKTAEQSSIEYDPSCYLCPGNPRAGGVQNPQYTSTFVFDNDFPALLPDAPDCSLNHEDLLVAQADRGICRVVCFSPKHNLSIPSLEREALSAVVDTWCEQCHSLEKIPFVRYVQVFENRGALMGASNPHPHCQIWATESIPNEIVKETAGQGRYSDKHGACLLCNYARVEANSEREICANQSFQVHVPFWAVWPFETIVISKRHLSKLEQLDTTERGDLGMILRDLTRRYDALLGVPFPYTMGFHQSPVGEQANESWHLHAHFYPPLLRSATVRKFMVGYEMLAGPQRDITPEVAAERLRAAKA